jgi:glyoxylase I family protein
MSTLVADAAGTIDRAMSNIEQTLFNLEQALLNPDVRCNPDAAAILLDEEFCEFGSSGAVYGRDQAVHALACEPPCEFAITNFNIVALRPDMAVVSYAAMRYDLLQRERSESLRSSVWVMRDGRWRLLLHQSTPVAS